MVFFHFHNNVGQKLLQSMFLSASCFFSCSCCCVCIFLLFPRLSTLLFLSVRMLAKFTSCLYVSVYFHKTPLDGSTNYSPFDGITEHKVMINFAYYLNPKSNTDNNTQSKYKNINTTIPKIVLHPLLFHFKIPVKLSITFF